MIRGNRLAPLVLAAMALVTGGAQPAGRADPAGVLGDLEERGMVEVAPSEMEVAAELLEKGDDRLLELQLELLETIAGAHDTEKRAEIRELEALEAEREARVEQAAYEFLVEQILSSGVASYWSVP